MTNPNEIWQIEVNDQIYEANVEDLCRWIAEGALLPADRVRRGNLRWLEARKVPLLNQFFNHVENNLPFPVLQTVTEASAADADLQLQTENTANAPTVNRNEIAETPKNFRAANQSFNSPALRYPSPNHCAVHPEDEPKYVCESCANYFCKLCPKSYGASVKICPLCGAICRLVADARAEKQKKYQYQNASTEGFGFTDFGRALAYPFKFRSSLIFGAVLFMIFTLGQTASAFGGMFLVASGVFCGALAYGLTFACLSNTLDNFSRGNLEANFMPDFDDFELRDDVVHPFFLSIGVYIVSFGLLIVLLVGAFYYAMKSFEQIETDKQKIVSGVFPNARENSAAEEAEFQKLEEMSRENRQARLESVAGKNPDAERESYNQMAANLLRLSLIFSIPIFLAFLWGAFYFPAACVVAACTRSFAAVINPLVGLDTIRRMGYIYAKILLMFFALGVFSFAVSGFLSVLFAPFDLPRAGNLPARIVGSWFTFYFSVVFAVILGSALFKCSDRLNLHRG